MKKGGRLQTFLFNNRRTFRPVILLDPAKEKLFQIDLTSKNLLLTEGIYTDIERFYEFISDHIAYNGAAYAIGGYDELRVVYNRSRVFDATSVGEEPRRRHL